MDHHGNPQDSGFYLSETEQQEGSEQGRDVARLRCSQAPGGCVWGQGRSRDTWEEEAATVQQEKRVDGTTWSLWRRKE